MKASRGKPHFLLIAYDFVGASRQVYNPIHDYVRSHNYLKLSESCYAVSTFDSVSTVTALLRPHLPDNTSFHVVRVASVTSFTPNVESGWVIRYML